MRFSSAAQAEGDSIRRQTAIAKAWCKKNGYQLDESTTFADEGVSGFRGKHRQKGALAAFLESVEAGRVPARSVLLIENLDRLSREGAWDAVPLLASIVNAGVVVVTLSPREMRYERGHDLTGLILAVVEFGRGHSESAMKSERGRASWEASIALAREGKGLVRTRLPGWVSEVDGKLVLNERAAVVRRLFSLAANGCGLFVIVRTLTEDGVPTFGYAKGWSKASVHSILTGVAAVGTYLPRKGKARGDTPLPNYYPAVVSEKEFAAVQAALADRKQSAGRIGGNSQIREVANLFGGLLRDARSGERMMIATCVSGTSRRRVLMPAGVAEGRTRKITFPAAEFEQAILSRLQEVRPADIVGNGDEESEATTIAADLASVRHRIAQIEEGLTGDGDVPALIAAVRKLNAKRLDLEKKLTEAQTKAARPQSAAWKDAKTLLAVAADSETRLRLRGLLRQVIEEIVVLIVPRKSWRIVVAQVYFAGGARRDYEITFRYAGLGRTQRMDVSDLRFEACDDRLAATLDLRTSAHADAMEHWLATKSLPQIEKRPRRREKKNKA
jgi:DNA invertase Pin-like site-specific DNA recombinase